MPLLCQMNIIVSSGTLIWFSTTVLSLSVPIMVCVCQAECKLWCCWFVFACLCHIYITGNIWFCSHMCTDNGGNQLCYIFFFSWSLVCQTLHRPLMAHSTTHSPHSDSVCVPDVCQHQKTHVQMYRWPLQSAPWCYLLITTCHPSTGKLQRKW